MLNLCFPAQKRIISQQDYSISIGVFAIYVLIETLGLLLNTFDDIAIYFQCI